MNKVEKIKAEIERLKNELSDNKERLSLGEIIAVNNCYNNLIFFIDSLLDTEKDFCIKSNDLEEAVNAYIGHAPEIDECSSVYGKRQAFKAGAQWQKERDQSTIELAEDHAYLAGQEKIIAKACEWLRDNIDKYLYNTGGYEVYIPKCGGKMFEDFKKAIKE